MPKYWGKQIFAQGRFPEVGQKQKTENRKRLDGKNNGQARKHAWYTLAAWAKKSILDTFDFFHQKPKPPGKNRKCPFFTVT